MAPQTTDTPAPGEAAPTDSGLRCPACEYNLTGLSEPRCPECGTSFTWEDVRLAAANQPTIAFEQVGGWRKVPAFFVTWAMVLLAPWIFARQAVRRVSLRHGLVFGAACFVPVTLRYALDSGFDASYPTWVCTAAIYLVLQALLLTGIDPGGWRAPREGFLFWLAVGGYTSAVVVTECFQAAPLVAISEIWEGMVDFVRGTLTLREAYYLVRPDVPWLGWVQIAVWLAGVVCCYWRRLRKRRVARGTTLAVCVLVAFLLFNLYAFCVEMISVNVLFEAFGGTPF
jgi:hypothetical protein